VRHIVVIPLRYWHPTTKLSNVLFRPESLNIIECKIRSKFEQNGAEDSVAEECSNFRRAKVSDLNA
jgi:hypothetical protein